MRPLRILWVFLLTAGGGLHSPLWAEDNPEPPPASSAEVIETKAREEARRSLLEPAEGPTERPIVETEEPVREAGPTGSFQVREIQLLGGEPHLPPDLLEPLLASYENRPIVFDDLTALCTKLEEAFRERGYVSTVFVPPQRIENGQVQLRAVLSRMGKLHLEGSRFFSAWKTASYWKIPEGRLLRYEEIRANVLDLNENPDRQVRALLRPGSQPETTDIHLRIEDRFPVHLGLSADNQGSKLTGKYRGGWTLQHNNLLGLDDIFFAGMVAGKAFGAAYAQHLIPVSSFGTRLITSFSAAQVSPKKEFAPFGVNGVSSTLGVALHQRLIRTQTIFMEIHAGFEAKEKRTRSLSVIATRDRLRVPSVGGRLRAIDPTGVWDLKQDLSFGLPFHDDDTSLTTRRSGSSFFKTVSSLHRSQQLVFGAKGVAQVEGQWSPDKLPPQEQFFLGGLHSVRGYPESDYGADQAIQFNLEYRILPPLIPDSWKLPWEAGSLKKQTECVVFLDYGYGRLEDPSATERSTRNLLGSGAGLNFDLSGGVKARFEWGYALGDRPITEGGRWQFYWRISKDF